VRIRSRPCAPLPGAGTDAIWSAASPRSSFTAVSATDSVASRTGVTVTEKLWLVLAVLSASCSSPPPATLALSVAVAVTVRSNAPEKSAGGVMVSASSCAWLRPVRLHVPPP